VLNLPTASPPLGIASGHDAEVLAGWWLRLFDLAEDAQLVCRRGGEIIRLNRRAARLFEVEAPSETPELSLVELVGEGVAERLKPLLQKHFAAENVLADVPLERADASPLIVEFHVTPLGDGCSLVVVKDVGRRHRMESHVQRLVTAMDSTTDVIYLTNTDGLITFVNCAFETTTGYSIEEALDRPLSFLRAPSESAQILEYSKHLHAGLEWRGELLNRCRDGRTYPVDVTFSPVFSPRGELLGHAGYERDISAQRQLQRELELRHDFVRSIINSIDAAIYTLDRDFCLTDVNNGWQKMPPDHGWLTLSGAPLPGKPLLDYVPDATRRQELHGLLTGVLQTQTSKELQTTSADGRHWAVKISPWTHAGGVRGLIYAVTDQTTFHQLQDQLFQAQKMETLGALAAGVAHDFNNLIQVVLGNTGLLLLETHLPTVWTHGLQQIDAAAKRAADVTRQLLSFSRASGEKIEVFELNQFLKDTCQLARRSLHSRVNICFDPCPMTLPVKMDTTRTHQMVLNLCVNAQDAMPAGGTLTLSTAAVTLTRPQALRVAKPPGIAFVRCSVSDTGTGIPPEVLPKIFEAFFTTKGAGKGTGLGLSIVNAVATQAGGFIEVESQPNRGTTFHLYLPRAEAEAIITPKTPPKPANRGSGCILIVDDEESIRLFSQRLLRSAGFEVHLARDGEHAMELLVSGLCRPNLVLTDYHMPNMTGIDLIRRAAALQPELKFVLVSGYLDDEMRRTVENELHARILNKPYHLREAVDLMIELISPPA
jgi:two-component system cell cycle sensor histidine kinase/response regulator CckA